MPEYRREEILRQLDELRAAHVPNLGEDDAEYNRQLNCEEHTLRETLRRLRERGGEKENN